MITPKSTNPSINVYDKRSQRIKNLTPRKTIFPSINSLMTSTKIISNTLTTFLIIGQLKDKSILSPQPIFKNKILLLKKNHFKYSSNLMISKFSSFSNHKLSKHHQNLNYSTLSPKATIEPDHKLNPMKGQIINLLHNKLNKKMSNCSINSFCKTKFVIKNLTPNYQQPNQLEKIKIFLSLDLLTHK